jgi:hypothetical protein
MLAKAIEGSRQASPLRSVRIFHLIDGVAYADRTYKPRQREKYIVRFFYAFAACSADRQASGDAHSVDRWRHWRTGEKIIEYYPVYRIASCWFEFGGLVSN